MAPYTQAEKRLVKTLAYSLGGIANALDVLRETRDEWDEMSELERQDTMQLARFGLTDRIPAPRVVKRWMKDPQVTVDQDWLRAFEGDLIAAVTGTARRIHDKLSDRLLDAIDEQQPAKELYDLARTWSIFADRMTPTRSSEHDRAALSGGNNSTTVHLVAYGPAGLVHNPSPDEVPRNVPVRILEPPEDDSEMTTRV